MTMLQGKHLLRGSRPVDFDIQLGDAACDLQSLTDTQVDCRPPTNTPNRHINDTLCPPDALSMSVCIHCLYLSRLFCPNL